MMFSAFDHYLFEESVLEAMDSVKRVLDTDRSPNVRLAEDVSHEYTDKYKMADLLTNTAIISTLVVLEGLGLTRDVLRSIENDRNSNGDSNSNSNSNSDRSSKATATATATATTLRFDCSETRRFVKEETVDVKLPFSKETKEVTTDLKDFGTEERATTKSTIETIVNRITRKHYLIEKEWEISVYFGTDVENRRVIQKRTNVAFESVRNNPRNTPRNTPDFAKDEPPLVTTTSEEPVELPLTWLLQQIDADELKSHFAIDTSHESTSTRTPKRNLEIDGALEFFGALTRWARRIRFQFSKAYPACIRNGNDEIGEALKSQIQFIEKLTADGIFVPVLPLMEDRSNAAARDDDDDDDDDNDNDDGDDNMDVEPESKAMAALPEGDNMVETESTKSPSPLLLASDTTRLVNEQKRTLGEAREKLRKQFSDPESTRSPFSLAEAGACVLCLHAEVLVHRYVQSIGYLEYLLEQQLVAAIGKKVSSSDLDRFMNYHNEKLLTPSPKPFCYTIRRPDHYPDGILSLEKEIVVDGDSGKTAMEPVSTHVRELASIPPTKVPLTAATTIELTGKTYFHGWLNHGFRESRCVHSQQPSVRLNARARQFSSFVLLVGTMASQNRLQPKDAIILRNKDELHIPLLLNEIPTATEFKDAIGSLSPEQQRFAKAFRSMQLESSVLGVCIIQIKPQLEKLLGLPQDSLTKEMKLTEDLTELFVEYQVPSDLVSYDGDMAMDPHEGGDGIKSAKDQVANVKEHVNSVLAVIAGQKKEQLEEQTRKADMAWEMEDQPMKAREEGTIIVRQDGTKVRRVKKQKQRGLMMSSGAPKPRSRSLPQPMSDVPRAMMFSPAPESIAYGMQIEAQGDQSRDGHSREQTQTIAETYANTSTSQSSGAEASFSKNDTVDFTAMPKVLDRAIERNDKDASIRSTTIQTAKDGWIRHRHLNLLSKAQKSRLTSAEIESERNKAFDLLDALSRSGSLDIPFSELHVLLCATHRFEKSVMETVIQDNINPIEKLELSTLVMASTVLDVPAHRLIRDETKGRMLAESFPRLVAAVGEGEASCDTTTTTKANTAVTDEATTTSVEI